LNGPKVAPKKGIGTMTLVATAALTATAVMAPLTTTAAAILTAAVVVRVRRGRSNSGAAVHPPRQPRPSVPRTHNHGVSSFGAGDRPPRQPRPNFARTHERKRAGLNKPSKKGGHKGTCSICLDQKATFDLAGCGLHLACTDCLRSNFLSSLRTLSAYPFTCFGHGCNSVVTKDALKAHRILRGDEEWTAYRRFSTLAQARDDPAKRAVHCPSCDTPQLTSSHAKGWVKRTCHNRSCHHGSFDVAPLETSLSGDSFKSTYWLLKNEGADFRRCPNCNFMIVRESGCRHIYCSCGHEFNWKSGRDWNSSTMPFIP